MTTSSEPYRVTVMWDPDASIASWIGSAPGVWVMLRYTLAEVEMMTGERPFPARGIRRVIRKILRPLLRVRGPSLPGPWAERNSAGVPEKIERWGRRAGTEWAKEHALQRDQRVLDDDDIVFECLVSDPRRPLDLDLDLME